jgi:anti-anti-sigma factor
VSPSRRIYRQNGGNNCVRVQGPLSSASGGGPYTRLFRALLAFPIYEWASRMSLSSYTKDGILTVIFDDPRITDETKLEQVGKDLLEMLNATTEERVILNFCNVKFMSSAMLGKLVQVHKKSAEYKVKLKLCSIDPEIRQVFKITRLDKMFDIEPDEAAARKAFMKKGWFG